MPDFISIVYLFTLTGKSQIIIALRTASNYLTNPPAKKRKRKTTITTKTNTKEMKDLLLITASCFSSRGRTSHKMRLNFSIHNVGRKWHEIGPGIQMNNRLFD